MKNIFHIAALAILLISIMPVTASEQHSEKIVEPNMIAAGHDCNTPWIKIKMGNAAGNSLSILRYKVGTGQWHYVRWEKGKIVTYKLVLAKGANPWNTEVQRISAKNKKVLESLYI